MNVIRSKILSLTRKVFIEVQHKPIKKHEIDEKQSSSTHPFPSFIENQNVIINAIFNCFE